MIGHKNIVLGHGTNPSVILQSIGIDIFLILDITIFIIYNFNNHFISNICETYMSKANQEMNKIN
jgi:hypothetical protein